MFEGCRTGELTMNDTMSIRRCISSAALALVGALISVPLSAQEWPARTVTVIVPLGAGTASDVAARVVMDQVGKQLGQAFVVENRPGAGGTTGANAVAKAAPDGTTGLAYGAMAGSAALYSRLPYDPLDDFVPVIALGQQPLAVVVSPSRGWKTLGDMVAEGKANPGKLNYGSAGIGSASHFGAERLRVSAGFEAQQIAFRGVEALTEIIAGRVDFSVQPFQNTLALIRDGKLVALAISACKRVAALPEVPTTIEAGLPPDSVYPFYTGVYLPAKTPPAIVARLHDEIAKALEAPAVRERLAGLGVESMPQTVAEFGKFFRDDVAANIALVKAAKIPTQ
jgi:tripartite-type tricarboxylate transporter receptor subunit TctC